MKKLLFLFFIISGLLTYGQDVIYKLNGDGINSKIIEITTSEIKYKDFDFQDGPTRNIGITNVFMIIYENGKREYFTIKKTQNTNIATTNQKYNQPTTDYQETNTNQNNTTSESQNSNTNDQPQNKNSFNIKQTIMEFDKSKIKLAAKAGFNLCNIHQNFENEDYETDTKIKLAINLGVIAEYNINNTWDFQTGLSLAGKGCKYDADGDPKLRLGYLEIPLNAVYKFNDFRFVAGSYLAFGLGGKYKSDDGDIKYKPVIGKVKSGDLDDDESAYRFFDFGLNLGASYPVGPVLLSANYELGLSNLTPKYESNSSYSKDYKMHNRVFSISAIYYIDDLMQLIK